MKRKIFSNVVLNSFLFFLICSPILAIPTAKEPVQKPENMTEEIFQEQRMLTLEGKLDSLLKKFEQILKTIERQGKMLHKTIADEKLEKASVAIFSGDQNKANSLWKETLTHIDESDTQETLKKMIISSYSKTRKNFYPILEFILKNRLYSGFPILYSELSKSDHLHTGAEIFILAKSIMKVCGKESNLYKSLPTIVDNVVSGPVFLQNVGNEGYLIAHDHAVCERVTFTECGEGNPRQEVYLHKFIEQDSSHEEELIDKRAQWEFVLPEDEGLPLSSGFLIKSVHSGEFVITKLRGASSFFLRRNTTFSSYYAKDRQCQYLPQTDKVKGIEDIRIGIKEKHVNNTDYFYADHFAKAQTLPLMKRSLFDTEKNEYFWKVIPVKEEDLDRSRSNTLQSYPLSCVF